MERLEIIWKELAHRYSGDEALIDELWEEIQHRYSAKKRHYHNLQHLEYMISKAFDFKDSLADFDTLLFAVFYHDFIYNPKRQDNEQRSADTAGKQLARLGLPDDKIAKCQKQILATKQHLASNDPDTDFLVDFDLAILGESWPAYQDYNRKIRQEYALYPDFLYKRGRKQVLQHFLEMDHIFKTQAFHDKYDQQAIDNLKTELAEL